MKKNLLLAIIIVAVISMLVIQACQHEIPGDPCTRNPISLSVTKTDATGSSSNGTISATASGGADFRYSLNGGAFQDTGYFTGLAPFQAYNVVVKNGCIAQYQQRIYYDFSHGWWQRP